MAVISTNEKPPHTNAMITAMEIQVDGVIGYSSALRRPNESISRESAGHPRTRDSAENGPRKVVQGGWVGNLV
jgi:hypothetical protein